MVSPSLSRPSASADFSRPSARTGTVAPPGTSPLGAPSAADPVAWTFRDLDRRFEAFLDTSRHVERKSLDTLRGYRGAFVMFRRFLAEGRKELPPTVGERFFDIEGFVAWNNRRGVSAVTTNHYWRALRPFFVDLERRDGVMNPFRGMRQPVTGHPQPKALSPEECRRVLLAADNYPWDSPFERRRAVAVLATVMYAGLRKKELLRLLYTDVDLDEGTISIRGGKGRGDGKDRLVFIAPELREVLDAFLRARVLARVTAPGFWASPRGGSFMSEAALMRVVKRVRRASGLPLGLHRLRHSFVTLLLKAGVPIHVVQNLAGHASIRTTEVYFRVWDDDKRLGVQRLSLEALSRAGRRA
ncbi:MAG: tyrosine-type recombinase/integrase [Thermoanaerobaculia bacterium]|nr:tyrosine-type recombinase/integrase [Thermoanaerobaculia bacterium]